MTKNLEHRDPKLYVKEIIEYIDDLKEITFGLTFESFIQQKIRMHALKDVLRDIAEAVWAVSKNKKVKELFYYYHIPYEKLCGMRHELTHEYFSADWPSIWNTAITDLPHLQEQFKKILNEL
jgi:uncharacterized protein with HEPN domain